MTSDDDGEPPLEAGDVIEWATRNGDDVGVLALPTPPTTANAPSLRTASTLVVRSGNAAKCRPVNWFSPSMPGPCPGSGLCSMYSGAYARPARQGGELASHNFTKSEAICSMLDVAVDRPMTASLSMCSRGASLAGLLDANPQTATKDTATRPAHSLTSTKSELEHRCRLESYPAKSDIHSQITRRHHFPHQLA